MTITKRNGKYYCRFQIDGERHHYLCAGASTEAEAKKLENQFMYKVQQQINGVVPRDKKIVTFEKLCDNYWKYALANNSDIKHVKSKIKAFKQYFGISKPIHKFTTSDMEEYKSYLISLGLSPSTINKYRSALIKLFNIAIDDDLILKNPCRTWKKMVEDNVKTVYWTKEEEEKFYKYSPEWLSDLVYLALSTGLRKANIRLFRKEWIDFKAECIKIPRTQNKGRKFIVLPINEELKAFLEKKIKDNDSEYLFINKQRKAPIGNIRIDTAFKDTCEKAEIQNIGFHGLRHTVGTRLGEKGVDIVVIQEILAHTSLSTTQRYRHNTPEKLRQAMSVLHS